MTEKNVSVMDDSLGIELSVVKHANGKDWWVITPRRNSNTFYKFKFTNLGITDTLVQTIGFAFAPPDERYGQSVFSPDGTKLYRANRNAAVQVYSFDRETGMFKDWDTIHYEYGDQFVGEIGCAISPSGQYMYLSCRKFLYQLDLWADDISASQITLSEWDGFTTPLPTLFYKCQLAPDCKIYTLAGGDTRYWHVIHNPDLPGLQCNVEQRGLVLPTRCGSSMPFPPNYRLGPIDNPGLPCTGGGVPVGVQEAVEQQKEGLWVYPNPASETVTIGYKMSSGVGGPCVRLCNTYGQVVREARLSGADGQVELSVVGLPEGVYFYFVEGVGSGKLVVVR